MSETLIPEAIDQFKSEWAELVRLGDLADAAFYRWFRKRESGQQTNGAAAQRAANRAAYQTANVHSAASRLYALGIDPCEIEPEYVP